MEKLALQLFADSAPQASVPEGESAGTDTQREGEGAEQRPPFRELIAGAYRQDYENAVGQRIQAAIQQRFRNQQDYRRAAEAAQPILAMLGRKYGLPPEDTEAIARKMAEEGRGAQPEDGGDDGREAGRMALRRHFRQLTRQAAELREEFPDFDLTREMRDPVFARLTAPGMGVGLREAFYAVHGPEIQRDSILYAVRQAEENVAASVRAGASRPQENGMGKRSPAEIGVDVRHLDRKEREEYRRRIKNGETINFRDLM